MDFLHTLSNCADNLHLGNLDGSLCGLIPADLPASNFIFIENIFLQFNFSEAWTQIQGAPKTFSFSAVAVHHCSQCTSM